MMMFVEGVGSSTTYRLSKLMYERLPVNLWMNDLGRHM